MQMYECGCRACNNADVDVDLNPNASPNPMLDSKPNHNPKP